MPIVAAPGLGASTLLSDGIAPALRARGFITLVFSEWQGRFFRANLGHAIAEAVRAQADPSFTLESDLLLPELLSYIRNRTGSGVAVLLDQFEDYLGCQEGTDVSDAFDAELSHAVASREGRFCIALHASAIPRFQRLSQYIPNLLGHRVSIGGLEPQAAQEMLAAAARHRDIEIEPEAMAALLAARSVQLEGGIHPALAMTGANVLLNAAREKNWSRVGLATIEAYGGPDSLILESLDPRIAELNVTQGNLFFRWGNILLRGDGEPLSERALLDFAGKLNRFAILLLPRLVELGILRTLEFPDGTRYEIARQWLRPMLQDWWTRQEGILIARRKARFRIRSISVAVACIVTLYVVWLLIDLKT